MLILLTGASATDRAAISAGLSRRLGLAAHDLDRSLSGAGSENGTKKVAELLRLGGDLEAKGGAVLHAATLEQAARDAFLGGGSRRWLDLASADLGAVQRASTSEVVEHAYSSLIRSGYSGQGKLRLAEGGPNELLDSRRSGELVDELLRGLGPMSRVLLIPPDFTRFHSGAGELTSMLYARLAGRAHVEVLPALGTHAPMTPAELTEMFPGIPADRFRIHDWRAGLKALGEVPGSFVEKVSRGRVSYPVRCEIDSLITDGGWDRIISVGQLVPHEVIGIAGHDKNIFVGTGGKDVIDRTHFLGAVSDMETIMGRAHSPVRDVLLYMAGQFTRDLPITHLLTVRERLGSGEMVTRGMFSGDDYACFAAGAPLVQSVNLQLFEQPLPKVVVYLDPSEFKTTWLGNKSVYRTRMAIADGGELLVIAPGVARFGEDMGIDKLIRRHGYRGTPHTLAAIEQDPELATSLSAAAHLIHGSSEGRFRIVYAAGGLSREEVASVGYEFADLDATVRRYDPSRLAPGMNRLPDGEEIFFVPNPAVGLWGLRDKFDAQAS